MSESEKFKKQFREDQWNRLMKDKDFRLAWDANDFQSAGEIGWSIIYPKGKTRKESLDKKYVEDNFY